MADSINVLQERVQALQLQLESVKKEKETEIQGLKSRIVELERKKGKGNEIKSASVRSKQASGLPFIVTHTAKSRRPRIGEDDVEYSLQNMPDGRLYIVHLLAKDDEQVGPLLGPYWEDHKTTLTEKQAKAFLKDHPKEATEGLPRLRQLLEPFRLKFHNEAKAVKERKRIAGIAAEKSKVVSFAYPTRSPAASLGRPAFVAGSSNSSIKSSVSSTSSTINPSTMASSSSSLSTMEKELDTLSGQIWRERYSLENSARWASLQTHQKVREDFNSNITRFIDLRAKVEQLRSQQAMDRSLERDKEEVPFVGGTVVMDFGKAGRFKVSQELPSVCLDPQPGTGKVNWRAQAEKK